MFYMYQTVNNVWQVNKRVTSGDWSDFYWFQNSVIFSHEYLCSYSKWSPIPKALMPKWELTSSLSWTMMGHSKMHLCAKCDICSATYTTVKKVSQTVCDDDRRNTSWQYECFEGTFAEKMFVRMETTTPLQLFFNILLLPQIILENIKVPDDTFSRDSEHKWVNKARI